MNGPHLNDACLSGLRTNTLRAQTLPSRHHAPLNHYIFNSY